MNKHTLARTVLALTASVALLSACAGERGADPSGGAGTGGTGANTSGIRIGYNAGVAGAVSSTGTAAISFIASYTVSQYTLESLPAKAL